MASPSLLIRYQQLRRFIGWTGFGFPFLLAVGDIVLGDPKLEASISAYYYTPMGDVFVGVLCAISVFFVTYRGYDIKDRVAGLLAAVSAVGVALFPTTPKDQSIGLVGALHYGFAVVLFGCFIVYSGFLFRKTDKQTPGNMKQTRNLVYLVCALVMTAAIVVAGLSILLGWKTGNVVFWCEAVALVAFGFSWLEKGHALAGTRVGDLLGQKEDD